LDEVLGSEEKYEDHITSDDSDSTFKGLFVSSTDELEDFLSRTGDSAIIETVGDGKRCIVTKDNFNGEVQQESVTVPTINQEPISSSHRVSTSFIPQLPSSSSSASMVPSQLIQPELPVVMGSDTMDHSVEKARDFVMLADDLWKKGDISGATENFTIAHSIYITHLGDADSSKEVAMILKKLGDLNQEDGALDAAAELYSEAMEMEMTAYGQHLPQTLNAAGVVCLKRDDFRSAMEFHRRALQIQKRSQGVGETGGLSKYETYETLVNIGNVYYSERNNFSNIRSNGVDYKEFIESGFLSWIALAHDMRGEYVKSIQFYEESLQISMTRKTKESRRETALTLNRLGSLTRELGRYDEAMDYHQKAMNIQKSGHVGISKATAAETCVLMGMVKSKLSDFRTALHLYEDSLIVLKKSLGDDHLSVSKTMAQIGSVHYELSNWEKALEYLADAEELQLRTVGEMNRDTLETQALIGRVLSATGNFEEALLKLKSVYERQNILFNSTHPTIADTLSYIGDCFLDQGMATEARGKFVDCYNMRKNFFTIDQIHIAESMVDIIRARSGQPGRALEIYQNAQEVYSEYLPDNHVQIGRLRVYEGDSFSELLNFTTAIERYEQAKQIFYTAFGGEFNIDYATVTVSIGRALLRKCDYDSAKKIFTSALVIYQQILPEEHLKIKRTLVDLDRVEQEEALCV
jgi:tetratricopeptide (TPR) repeat protein